MSAKTSAKILPDRIPKSISLSHFTICKTSRIFIPENWKLKLSFSPAREKFNILLQIKFAAISIEQNLQGTVMKAESYHANVSNRKQMWEGEGDKVVDGGGGGELRHREQRDGR